MEAGRQAGAVTEALNTELRGRTPNNVGKHDDRRRIHRSSRVPRCCCRARLGRRGTSRPARNLHPVAGGVAEVSRGALQPCVDRIRSLDGDIQAWVQVLPQKPTGNGASQRDPVRVKDIIETRGLATEYGSPIYKGRIGTADAAIVRQLCASEEASCWARRTLRRSPIQTPARRTTRATWRTRPAVVRAGPRPPSRRGWCPLPSGPRPADRSCGRPPIAASTGFKTSYGLIPMDGVLPFAKSLDTLGFFTHTAADMLAFWERIGYRGGSRGRHLPSRRQSPFPDVEPAMATAFRSCARAPSSRRPGDSPCRYRADARPGATGATEGCVLRGRPISRGALPEVRRPARRHREPRSRWPPDPSGPVRRGSKVHRGVQDQDGRDVQGYASDLDTRRTGPGPEGLASTGDSRLNGPWTALGTPAITIPMPVGSALPLGLQMTADHGQDAGLLHAAIRLERLLGQERVAYPVRNERPNKRRPLR